MNETNTVVKNQPLKRKTGTVGTGTRTILSTSENAVPRQLEINIFV
jgi:hypothetical protein